MPEIFHRCPLTEQMLKTIYLDEASDIVWFRLKMNRHVFLNKRLSMNLDSLDSQTEINAQILQEILQACNLCEKCVVNRKPQ